MKFLRLFGPLALTPICAVGCLHQYNGAPCSKHQEPYNDELSSAVDRTLSTMDYGDGDQIIRYVGNLVNLVSEGLNLAMVLFKTCEYRVNSGQSEKDFEREIRPIVEEGWRRGERARPVRLEMEFRIDQMNETVRDALQSGADAAISETFSVGKFYEKVVTMIVTANLGGVMSFPLPGEKATVWIGSSGYGNRHVPRGRGYQKTEFMNDGLPDLAVEYHYRRGAVDDSYEIEVKRSAGQLREAVSHENDQTIESLTRESPLAGMSRLKQKGSCDTCGTGFQKFAGHGHLCWRPSKPTI